MNEKKTLDTLLRAAFEAGVAWYRDRAAHEGIGVPLGEFCPPDFDGWRAELADR